MQLKKREKTMLISIDNVWMYLSATDSTIGKLIDDEFSFPVENAFWIRKNHQKIHPNVKQGCWQCNWDGKHHFLSRGRLPSGFVGRLADLLDANSVPYQLVDNRKRPERQFNWSSDFDMRDYQEEIIETALTEGRGIIEAATGAGKTVIATELICRLGLPTMVVVPTKIILNQFESTMKDHSDIPLGIIQGSTWDEKPVVVCTMGALTEYPAKTRQLMQNVDVLVVDEYHKSAAKTWYEAICQCPAFFRFGQTATPFRKTALEDQYLYACTGPIIASVKTDELQGQDVLADTDIRFIKCHVNPPSEVMGTYTNELGDEENGWIDAKFVHQYRECIVENVERNLMVAEIVNHHLKKGDKVLVIVAWTSHADKLIPLFDEEAIYLSGKDTKNQAKKKAEEFAERKAGVLIGSPVIDLGYDIPDVNVVVNAAAGEAKGRAQQRLGRGLRRTDDKTNVAYYDFFDIDVGTKKKHFQKHAKSRMETFEGLGQSVTVYDSLWAAIKGD